MICHASFTVLTLQSRDVYWLRMKSIPAYEFGWYISFREYLSSKFVCFNAQWANRGKLQQEGRSFKQNRLAHHHSNTLLNDVHINSKCILNLLLLCLTPYWYYLESKQRRQWITNTNMYVVFINSTTWGLELLLYVLEWPTTETFEFTQLALQTFISFLSPTPKCDNDSFVDRALSLPYLRWLLQHSQRG